MFSYNQVSADVSQLLWILGSDMEKALTIHCVQERLALFARNEEAWEKGPLQNGQQGMLKSRTLMWQLSESTSQSEERVTFSKMSAGEYSIRVVHLYCIGSIISLVLGQNIQLKFDDIRGTVKTQFNVCIYLNIIAIKTQVKVGRESKIMLFSLSSLYIIQT